MPPSGECGISEVPEQSDVISSGCGEEFLSCCLRALSKAYRAADQPETGESFAANEPRRWGG